MEEVTVIVSGLHASGKTTIATMIQNALKAQNINVNIQLTNHEMMPCPAALRQRAFDLIDSGLVVNIIEVDKKP